MEMAVLQHLDVSWWVLPVPPADLEDFFHNIGHFLEMLLMVTKQLTLGKHSGLQLHLCSIHVAWLLG